jgi:hypothetical protein
MYLRINDTTYDIKVNSNVYDEYVKCIETNEMDLSEHFSEENVKTLRDIAEGNITDKAIDVDTYRLIDFLDLNYLLFNYSIRENSSVTNERIKEYYKIIRYPKDKNFLKNLLRNLGNHTVKLLNYYRLETLICVCKEAAKINNLECLKYAHENDCPWDENTCLYAARNGYLECLKYAYENGCPWDENTCIYAALNGHLECLIYAHEHGCPWDTWTCAYAALNGHLECLIYAHEHGCLWDKRTCVYAVEKGQLECLNYACDNKCPDYEKYMHVL